MKRIIFTLIQLVSLFIDTVLGWLGLKPKAFNNGRLRVVASPELRSLFHLHPFEEMRYPDRPYSGHIATILCAVRPPAPIPYQRETHPGGDGNPICLDWYYSKEGGSRVALLIPGLSSSSRTNYITTFVRCAHQKGIHCCVFNSRGLGDTPLEKPRLMSARYTEDLRSVMAKVFTEEALASRFQNPVQVLGVGFSLGGVILSKYVGEQGEANAPIPLRAAIVANSPVDAVHANTVMSSRICRLLYQPHMSQGLVQYALRHKALLKDIPQLPSQVKKAFQNGQFESVFRNVKTVYDFDSVISAPANGYENPDEYYRDITPLKWIPKSSIPLLCISNADDPACGPFPEEAFNPILQQSSRVGYIIVPFGGHLGYIQSIRSEWSRRPNFLEETVSALVVSFGEKPLS